jgi:hypothetical protein
MVIAVCLSRPCWLCFAPSRRQPKHRRVAPAGPAASRGTRLRPMPGFPVWFLATDIRGPGVGAVGLRPAAVTSGTATATRPAVASDVVSRPRDRHARRPTPGAWRWNRPAAGGRRASWVRRSEPRPHRPRKLNQSTQARQTPPSSWATRNPARHLQGRQHRKTAQSGEIAFSRVPIAADKNDTNLQGGRDTRCSVSG